MGFRKLLSGGLLIQGLHKLRPKWEKKGISPHLIKSTFECQKIHEIVISHIRRQLL
jgi:hypothetical protein